MRALRTSSARRNRVASGAGGSGVRSPGTSFGSSCRAPQGRAPTGRSNIDDFEVGKSPMMAANLTRTTVPESDRVVTDVCLLPDVENIKLPPPPVENHRDHLQQGWCLDNRFQQHSWSSQMNSQRSLFLLLISTILVTSVTVRADGPKRNSKHHNNNELNSDVDEPQI